MDQVQTEINDQIPSGLQDLLEEMRAAKAAEDAIKVDLIGKEVARKRDDAVKGRKASGIESIWEEDEEHYQGVDDMNRDTHPWIKSASTSGGISRTSSESSTRCTAFFNITRQFVDAAAARMGDILLPAGDWNFGVSATPVQDGTPPVGTDPAQYNQWVKQQQSVADAKAEKADLKLQDWLTECSYHTEVRKVIEDAAKLGTGVIKGPFPYKQTTRVAKQSNGQTTMEIASSLVPRSKHVDLWDCFPDPACGENIHDGNYFLERDRLTARQLKDLKGMKGSGYLDDQIDKVLDEGPGKRHYDEDRRNNQDQTKDDEKFEVWYYYGLIDPDSLSAMNVSVGEEDSQEKLLPAVVTLVNETPIKAFINPLDTGEYPYDFMVWQRMSGTPYGQGVARQGRTPQDMLNSTGRAMMDNAGLSAGPMLVIRQNAIRPADGKWNLTARKVWIATEQADVRSVADAIIAITIPMVQKELSEIIALAMKMMEDSTGLSYLLQGQQGSAPDTVGGMELLHKNASAYLRRLARTFDELVTEPHMRRYYEWLLLHGPEECKGDLKITAIGSTALVEREINSLQSMQLLQFSANPVYGLDPESAMMEVLKAMRFNPEKWQLSDEKKKQLQSQPPPEAPAVQAAKIRADVDMKRLEAQLQEDRWETKVTTQASLRKMEIDTDRDTAYNDSMFRRDETNAQVRMQELIIKRELAMLEYANTRNVSLDNIKADLAKESMRLRTQKELAGAAHAAAKQVAATDMEPVGRAENGHAFEQ